MAQNENKIANLLKRGLIALFCALIASQAGAATISNTATVNFQYSSSPPLSIISNTNKLNTLPAPTPAVIQFLRYAPGVAGASVIAADGGLCRNSAGAFAPIPSLKDFSGGAINTASASMTKTGIYHAGEAVFVSIADANRNLDAATREFVEVRVTTSPGDEEVARLQETSANSGIFAAALPSATMPPQANKFDCRLSLAQESKLSADYTDTEFASDSAHADALVDPFGVVFDSATGAPVNGAIVTLMNAITGQPATVFGDDGMSAFPSTVTSGGSVTDASGRAYTFPPGGFRFPFIPPGDYVLRVTAPAGFAAPSTVALPALQAVNDPSGNPYAVVQGSLGDRFTVPFGPIVNIDIPVDPVRARLLIQKSVSATEVSAGDFLQYRVTVENRNTAAPMNDVVITDRLPLGMRYRGGSLRINGQNAADPSISSDGRTLTITVGAIATGAKAELSYVVQVGAGSRKGEAVNRAVGTASGGVTSNVAFAVVRVREPFFTSQFTIIGRVVEGECDRAWDALKGVPNIRMLLEDGTYVATDVDGQFHFEGVRPGTHVVQLDLDSLPPHLEAVPCIQNTRFAGRSFSQFVEAQGGSLWRTDFYVRAKAGVAAPIAPRAENEGSAASATTEGVQRAVPALPAAPPRHFVSPLLDEEGKGSSRHVVSRPPGEEEKDAVATAREPEPHSPETPFPPSQGGATQSGGVVLSEKELTPSSRAPADGGITSHGGGAEAKAVEEKQTKRRSIADDVTAAGGKTDWLTGQTPGVEWLFPAGNHNPRAPTVRVAIKHAPNQKIVLKNSGERVHELNFDGAEVSADKTIAVSVWRGLPLKDGDNLFDADVMDETGKTVTTLSRTVHYANQPARAVLVPEESVLVADGIHKPVIAVRILDRDGRPVRAGITGAIRVNPPYVAAQEVEFQQQRQLAGLDRYTPTYKVEGDDGIAYIELAPTTESGNAVLSMSFQQNERTPRTDELRVWLEGKPRDWVVVGFGSGTVGYNTLKGNMQSLSEAGADDDVYTDGQVSLYAKGQVLGKWLMTMAYDSDKPGEQRRREGVLSTIDPQQFYTLYGDGAQQRYDASSQEKLYLKIERDQFYALFGDFETGLTQTVLARYSRTLTGVKSEFRGELINYTAFASDTAQNFARDEIQGNGTSGLYRLSRGNIVINGEKIRIETRDRIRSQIIVQSRQLLRHIDYDIDYAAGTLFFREPILSRDFNFNPNFIVAEYETFNAGDKELNAGGRIGTQFLDGKVQAGVSVIRDAANFGATDLGGVDVKVKVAPTTEVRVEAAKSGGQAAQIERDGSGYLAEIEHHDGNFDALAYARRQAPGFGVNQQNAAESGTFKAGADAQYKLNQHTALQGQAYRQENLVSRATRDAGTAQLEYREDLWSARVGALFASDEAITGETFDSRQATLGASRYFLDKRLEVNAQADISLGGKNDSVDFPSRYTVGAAYAINESLRLLAAQEYTDGEQFSTATTRFGFQAVPWKNAKLTSTLNQSHISEYGPRTFGLFGLTQSFLVDERWGFDASVDTSRTLKESGNAPLVINQNQPIASGGVL
ncbi:MAG: DUF11 domain-containing protein, partial [Burkholderiales bacterium]|nr:DUF11 domain-containing protein [Burkholderiales bacterium]